MSYAIRAAECLTIKFSVKKGVKNQNSHPKTFHFSIVCYMRVLLSISEARRKIRKLWERAAAKTNTNISRRRLRLIDWLIDIFFLNMEKSECPSVVLPLISVRASKLYSKAPPPHRIVELERATYVAGHFRGAGWKYALQHCAVVASVFFLTHLKKCQFWKRDTRVTAKEGTREK